MKGVTRIEGLGLAPDFPFRLLPASESPIWPRGWLGVGQRWLQSTVRPLLTLGDFGNLGSGSRSELCALWPG